MGRERWGTFAVNDHLRKRPFAIDVLLYDRLVIPYPQDSERLIWENRGWKPDQLEKYLEILGELAIPTCWDARKQELFKTRYAAAQAANFDVSNLSLAKAANQDPYYLTRVILGADFLPELPKGVSEVWAVAAYPSSSAYKKDYTSDSRQERKETLGLVLAHKFLVPKPTGKSDKDFLRETKALAMRDDFQEKRAQLYRWQEEIIEKEIPDHKAIEEMEQYLNEYNHVVRRAHADLFWKIVFTVIPIGLTIAGAPQITPLVVAGALVSIARFVKFDRRPNIHAGECSAAAMFHDIRKNIKMEAL